jgi:hypothetical protein
MNIRFPILILISLLLILLSGCSDQALQEENMVNDTGSVTLTPTPSLIVTSPTQEASRTGSIHVSSTLDASDSRNPDYPHAYVYLDGILKGTTPITLSGVSAGSHKITAIKSGYCSNFEENITVIANRTRWTLVTFDQIGSCYDDRFIGKIPMEELPFITSPEVETSSPEKNASNYLNEKKPATAPLPFIGTTWILKTYQDSDGQMVDYVPTTMMVNVLFNASGYFSGFDGCNWHGGSYTLIGQNGISMNTHGPTTLMFCFGRETPYLSLLSSISSYETTTEGMLNLRDANGTVVLVYSGQ